MKRDLIRETTRRAELIEVIMTESARGSGTQEDPVRGVTQYWSKEGVLLAEKDNWDWTSKRWKND